MDNRIVNRTKGSIADKEYEGLTIDYADIPWYASGKRIQKLVSKKGTSIGVRLDSDSVARGLLQGDVLEVTAGEAIVVNIMEEKCIVVRMKDLKTVAKVCYEIGNRHAPLFYNEDDSELILPYDQPMLEMLKKLDVEIQVKNTKIHRDRSISSVNVSHDGHSHNHDHDQGDHHSHSHDIEHRYVTEHRHENCI